MFDEHEMLLEMTILLTKTTAAQNEVELSYYKVRGLYYLAVVFAATIINTYQNMPDVEFSFFCNTNKNIYVCY